MYFLLPKESEGARSGAAQLIVLITDGISSDTVATVEAARDLRAGGVTISAVAVGDSIDQVQIQLRSGINANFPCEFYVADRRGNVRKKKPIQTI